MKHYFNMVEVLLALGITAVGIVGLMAVIPVSLKATRDAQAEYFATEVANSEFDRWESDMRRTVKAVSPDDNDARKNAFKAFFDEAWFNGSDTDEPDSWSPMDVTLSKDGMNIGGVGKNFSMPAKNMSGGDYTQLPSVFPVLVGRREENIADFSGDVKIWKQTNLELFGDDMVRVFIEVSWPAVAAYDAREKRIFCRDYVNSFVEHYK